LAETVLQPKHVISWNR